MIKVKFVNQSGCVTKVSATGHSGLAESGNDILCAAVSALVQTAYLALKDIGANPYYKRDDKNGMFEFTLDAHCAKRHDCDVIIRALYVGLSDLADGYANNLKLEV